MPPLLKKVSYSMPFTLSAISLKNVLLKGFGLTEPSVYIGFVVVAAWTAGFVMLSIKILQINKFSRNT